MDQEFWDKRYATSELIWTDKPNMFLLRETKDLQPGTALDLACGEGRNAIWLAEHGWKVLGSDFSGVALEKGRSLAQSRGAVVQFEQHDATSWKPELTFDLVAVFYLQLPPVERHAALDNAAGAVAPGGCLLVVAHDIDNLEHGVGGPQDPEVLYAVEEVVSIVTAAGLDAVTAEQGRRDVRGDSGTHVAIDCVVKAFRPKLTM